MFTGAFDPDGDAAWPSDAELWASVERAAVLEAMNAPSDAEHTVGDVPAGDLADAEAWPAPEYDAIDEVLEVATMMSVFAAQRYRRLDALRREALAETKVFRGAIPEVIERSLRLELAMAMRLTETAVDRMLAEADALVHRYPSMLDSLAGGRTTERHAQVFVELVAPVEEELLAQVVGPGVELAERLPLGSFRRELRKLVDTVRVATLAERHREAVAMRRVVLEPQDDGMAWLSAYLPAVEARAIHSRLTEMATVMGTQECETRSRDQLRADLLGDLLVDGRVDAHPKRVRGVQATVVVTVPVLSLLDDDLAAASDPAVVEGVGPIPIERARELCGGVKGWMRVLTHPETGVILSVGRTKYRPPPPLRRLVRWRAGTCMGPGCGMHADRCEIDHNIPWEEGGRTELANLCPLCKGHHTLKHHGGWQMTQMDGGGGAIEWISPTGRRYVTEPEHRIPVFRASKPDPATEGTAPF